MVVVLAMCVEVQQLHTGSKQQTSQGLRNLVTHRQQHQWTTHVLGVYDKCRRPKEKALCLYIMHKALTDLLIDQHNDD